MKLNLYEKMKRIEALKDVDGLESMLTEAYKILGNPMVMFDIDYKLITNNENVVTDDPLWNDIIINGRFGGKSQELVKEEGFLDAIANAEVITMLTSDKLKCDRMLGKLFNKNNVHVASLGILESNRKFEYDDPLLFEAVCQIFSGETGSSLCFESYGTTLEETLISKLIDGNITDKKHYSVQIAALYNGMKDNLFLAVIDTPHYNIEYTNIENLRELLSKAYPDFKYSMYSKSIVIVFSSDSEKLQVKKDLGRLEKILKQKNMYAGISRRFSNLFALSEYYSEARDLLKKSLLSKPGKRIFLFEDEVKSDL